MDIKKSEVIFKEINEASEFSPVFASTKAGKSRLIQEEDIERLINNDEHAEVSDNFIIEQEEPRST